MIDWPLNELIADKQDYEVELIYSDGFLVGIKHESGGRRVTQYNLDGTSLSTADADLIPLKREPRTVNACVDWNHSPPMVYALQMKGCASYTLTHPDDRQPITWEEIADIHDAHTDANKRCEAIVAYLKERGYD